MADRVMRLTNLIALLVHTPRPLTLDEIRRHIDYAEGESGRMAFIRDRRTLEAEGIAVTMTHAHGDDAGAGAYRIRPEDYYLPDLGLTDDEQVALNLALASMRLDSGWGDQAAWKLGGMGDATPVLASLPAADALPRFFDGWRTRAPVMFRYNGKARTLEVFGLLCRDGFWYAIGHDRDAGERRTYRVDRVERPDQVKLGEAGAYTVPDDFDPGAALPADPKMIGSTEPVDVEVRVDPLLAPKAVAEVGPERVVSRQDDGSVVMQVPVVNRDAFRSWLLGYVTHAEVIGPADVRDEIVSWLEDIVARAGAR